MGKQVFYIFGVIFLGAGLFYFFMPKDYWLKHNYDLATESCLINADDKIFEIELTPKPLDPTKVFYLKVSSSDTSVNKGRSFLFGLKSPYLSEKVELKKEQEAFYGTEMFPYCTRGVMPWKLYVELEGVKKIYKANFKFEVNRE